MLTRLVILLLALLLPSLAQAFSHGLDCADNITGFIRSNTCVMGSGLSAGASVVGGTKWEGSSISHIISVTSDRSDTCAYGTVKYNSGSSNEPSIQLWYCTNMVGGATTITVTMSDDIRFSRLRGEELIPAGGGTISFESAAVSNESTTGQDPVTGTLTTANVSEWVMGFVGGYSALTWTSPVIGGSAATMRGDCSSTTTDTCLFDLLTSSTITGGTATIHQSASNRWTIGALAFTESGVTCRGALLLLGAGGC